MRLECLFGFRSRKHNRSLAIAQTIKGNDSSVASLPPGFDGFGLSKSIEGLEKDISEQLTAFFNHQLLDFGDNSSTVPLEIVISKDVAKDSSLGMYSVQDFFQSIIVDWIQA